jgi:hypothetical protein
MKGKTWVPISHSLISEIKKDISFIKHRIILSIVCRRSPHHEPKSRINGIIVGRVALASGIEPFDPDLTFDYASFVSPV